MVADSTGHPHIANRHFDYIVQGGDTVLYEQVLLLLSERLYTYYIVV